MPRRMGRPGLIGTMARTAVIAGTATAVAGGVRNAQTGRAQAAQQEEAAAQQSAADMQSMQNQLSDLQAQNAPAPAQAAPPDDLMAQLEKLGSMKSAGLLDDAEFAAAKAKILAG